MGWMAQQSYLASRSSHNGVRANLQGLALLFILTGVCGIFYMSQGDIIALVGAIISGFLTLALGVTMGCDNTFFIKEPLPTSIPTQGDEAFKTHIRWSGQLRLHERDAQRFMNMPVKAVRLQDGSFAVASNIDASTEVFGFKVFKRIGMWMALPRPESFEIEAGNLYFGFQSAPSLRVNFIDGYDKKKMKAILSFNTVETRDRFYTWMMTEMQTPVRPYSYLRPDLKKE
jgi:hypothetical protein